MNPAAASFSAKQFLDLFCKIFAAHGNAFSPAWLSSAFILPQRMAVQLPLIALIYADPETFYSSICGDLRDLRPELFCLDSSCIKSKEIRDVSR